METSPPKRFAGTAGAAVRLQAPSFVSLLRTASYYVRLLKPRETLLLTLIGVCTALVAGGGAPSWGRFALVSVAVLLGSGGANGLTNYLDRRVDARMRRTRGRVLAQGLIAPPEKALAWAGFLVAVALGLALYLHPYAFVAGTLGLLCAVVGRKSWATHLLGAVSSCGPVWVGWFAINPHVNVTIALLSAILLLWEPVHVWSLMMAYRKDYLQAGVNIFPLNRSLTLVSWLSCSLVALVLALSVALWRLGGFGWIYLGLAGPAGLLMMAASLRTVQRGSPGDAYRTFKLSAYPFLGLLFLGLLLDTWAH